MDKQDFQEQDFMEILMRLPCHRGRVLAPPQWRLHVTAMACAFLEIQQGTSIQSRTTFQRS